MLIIVVLGGATIVTASAAVHDAARRYPGLRDLASPPPRPLADGLALAVLDATMATQAPRPAAGPDTPPRPEESPRTRAGAPGTGLAGNRTAEETENEYALWGNQH